MLKFRDDMLIFTWSYLHNYMYVQFHRFLLKFTGKDEEINLLGDGSEKPEFGEWSWMAAEQIIDLVG